MLIRWHNELGRSRETLNRGGRFRIVGRVPLTADGARAGGGQSLELSVMVRRNCKVIEK